jgi:hypothetical protein
MRIAVVALVVGLLGGAAVAAPLPTDNKTPVPAPNAVAPRVLALRPVGGKLKLIVHREEQVALGVPAAPAGQPQPLQKLVTVRVPVVVELAEVKGLTVTTADGKRVAVKDAVGRLANGGVVVVSDDGKAIDPAFLASFRPGVLVLASPELAVPQGPPPGLGGPNNVLPAPVQAVPGVPPVPRVVPAPAPVPPQP